MFTLLTVAEQRLSSETAVWSVSGRDILLEPGCAFVSIRYNLVDKKDISWTPVQHQKPEFFYS